MKSDTDSLVEKLERFEDMQHFESINNKEFTLLKSYILSSNLSGSSTVDAMNLCDDIEKLSDLVDSGVLTKKEFYLQKEKILSVLTAIDSL